MPSALVQRFRLVGGAAMLWRLNTYTNPVLLKATAYLNIAADHVHPFVATVYPSLDGYFQQDNVQCHHNKASHVLSRNAVLFPEHKA